jgi:uncharacterized Tic20 family protein
MNNLSILIPIIVLFILTILCFIIGIKQGKIKQNQKNKNKQRLYDILTAVIIILVLTNLVFLVLGLSNSKSNLIYKIKITPFYEKIEPIKEIII